jgi:hypothetical protein
MRYAVIKDGKAIVKCNSRIMAKAFAREFNCEYGVTLPTLLLQVFAYYVIVGIGVCCMFLL